MSVKDSSGNEIINVFRRDDSGGVTSYRNIDYTMARHDGRYEQTFAATNTVSAVKDTTTGELSKDFKSLKCHKSRNLFDVSTITPNCYINDEGQITENDTFNTSDFIKVSANTNYTYKGTVALNVNTIRIAYYDQSKTFISRHYTTGNALNGETITTPSNCEYVKLSYDKGITNLMLNTGTSPLPYEPYGELYSADLKDYRIYGDTSKNILPLSKTPKTETIGDILCEYDGKGTFTFTSDVDSPSYPDYFIVDLIEPIVPPLSIRAGGTGCIQLNNTRHADSEYPRMNVALYNADELDALIDIDITSDYIVSSDYQIQPDSPETATSVAFLNMDKIGKGTITFKVAMYENVSSQQPFEPYGESVGDRTGNLFDGKIVNGTFSSTEGTLTTAGNRVRMDGNNFIYLQPGTYTINANGVDDVVYYAYTDDDITTFIKSDSYISWLGLPCTFTVNTARYFLFGFRFSDNTAVSVSDISNIMLNSGSTALPYEPYGYRVPVKVVGKNLFDGDLQQGTLDGVGTDTQNANRVRTSFMSNPLPAGTYTVSASGVDKVMVYFYSQPTTFVYRSSAEWINLPYTFTIDENYYIRFIFNTQSGTVPISPDDISDVMLNSGSTALHYEPYQPPITTNIYLPEQIKMVGDEAEYIDFGEQKMVKKTKTITFTDNTGWKLDRDHNFYIVLPANEALPSSFVIENSMNIPSVYIGLDPTIASGIDANIWISGMGNLNLYLTTIDHTLEALGQLFESTPLIVTYELANMSDLDVTLPTLPTLYKTNTISVESTVAPTRADFTGYIKTISGGS